MWWYGGKVKELKGWRNGFELSKGEYNRNVGERRSEKCWIKEGEEEGGKNVE